MLKKAYTRVVYRVHQAYVEAPIGNSDPELEWCKTQIHPKPHKARTMRLLFTVPGVFVLQAEATEFSGYEVD